MLFSNAGNEPEFCRVPDVRVVYADGLGVTRRRWRDPHGILDLFNRDSPRMETEQGQLCRTVGTRGPQGDVSYGLGMCTHSILVASKLNLHIGKRIRNLSLSTAWYGVPQVPGIKTRCIEPLILKFKKNDESGIRTHALSDQIS